MDRAGQGQFRGGDGLIREVELLADAQMTLLAERRKLRPYGLQGGQEGAPGCAWFSKTEGQEVTELPGKCSIVLPKETYCTSKRRAAAVGASVESNRSRKEGRGSILLGPAQDNGDNYIGGATAQGRIRPGRKNPVSKKIRVLAVDDHPLLREGIAAVIDGEEDIELVAEATTGQEAIELFRLHRPDVALIDLQMPGMNGIEAITAIRSEFSGARFIVLTTYQGDVQALRALKAGASGYLLKT